MIERTTFDLRIAEHSATAARVNRDDWRRQGEHRPHPALATLLAWRPRRALRQHPRRALRRRAA